MPSARAALHLGLAVAHRVHLDQFVGVPVGDLHVEDLARHHADGPRTTGPGRRGDLAHHRDPGAAADQRVSAPGQLGADGGGQVEVPAVDDAAGRGVDADRGHQSLWSTGTGSPARSAATMIRTASATSSVTVIRSRSAARIFACPTTVLRSQSSRPAQYSVPNRITGKRVTLPVCTRVSASNVSSSVPNPPGRITNACPYLTNIVLR